jgi:uncharacterized protein YbjT (DUF2867 family)
MSILVTGASGYVGTQLIAQLLRDGKGPVRGQVRSAAREGGRSPAVHAPVGRAHSPRAHSFGLTAASSGHVVTSRTRRMALECQTSSG